jgi:hypothetical protein
VNATVRQIVGRLAHGLTDSAGASVVCAVNSWPALAVRSKNAAGVVVALIGVGNVGAIRPLKRSAGRCRSGPD